MSLPAETSERSTTDPSAVAASATTHAFLNSYLRETGTGEIVTNSSVETAIRFELPTVGVEIVAPLRYRSPTGRHLFDLPARFRAGDDDDWTDLDYATLASLVVKQLALKRGGDNVADELLSRVLASKEATERFVAVRGDDRERLYGTDFEFVDAEQSLLFGHLLHPTPKSRDGIAHHDAPTFAPELRGSFPLHYFRASLELVAHESARAESAVEWVKSELREDSTVSESFVSEHVESEDVLIPVHPWQAEHLLRKSFVQSLVADGTLQHLGPVGREYFPTSSVRTLYSPESSFMVKGSLAVTITNSERTNKRPELERGVAITELLDTELGDELRSRFPNFDVVRDPAYLTVEAGRESGSDPESGFEVVLRENPFRAAGASNATPVVGLCQDSLDGENSRLGNVVAEIAAREDRSTAKVSEDWFRRYLERSIRPVLWLYLTHGVGLEAHQQNSVLTLREGYPDEFRYRDNQGYYFAESTLSDVEEYLPGVAERMDTLVSDALADERIRYYVILNNAFGVVNAFGSAGLVDERDLLAILREELESLAEFEREESSLVSSLLTDRRLPCKANLLTRFRGMDELTGTLENQSIYSDVPNPLVTELEVTR